METRLRMLTIACAVVFLAGVVSAFSVGDDDADLASVDGSTTTTTAAGDDLATDDSTTTTAATDGSTTTTAAGETTTTAAGATTTTAAKTTTTGSGSTTPETGPTTPGTYTYDVSGTTSEGPVEGTSVLTVSSVDGDGRQTQTQKGDEGESTTVYRYAPEGRYLESITMVQGPASFTLVATSPFLVVPSDAKVGTVTTGRLEGDGLVANVRFEILELSDSTSKAQLDADITGKAFGCTIVGNTDSTITARTADQLPLDTRAVNDIELKGATCLAPGTISSDVRTVLRD